MLIFAVSNQTTKHMKLSTHIIALDFEHQRDYFPTEMGVTIINNDFTVGDTVRILTGPFSGMEGRVNVMNDQTQVANVMTMLFGRETPTDISYNDLQKVTD